MALLQTFNSFVIFYFSLCFISVYTSEYVPVYMWDTLKNDNPLPALSRLNYGDFKHILLDKLERKDTIILVFAEESLSPEDFKLYDSAGNDVFTKLSNMKHKAHVNYYPYVETPIEVLKNAGVNVTEVSNIVNVDYAVKTGNILIIHLNDAQDDEDRSQMLNRHDSSVYTIYKKIASKHKNVIALLTGRHSSWVVPSALEGESRQARHLMGIEKRSAYDKANPFYLNLTNLFMWTLFPPNLRHNNYSYSLEYCKDDEDFNIVDNDTIAINFCANTTVDQPGVNVFITLFFQHGPTFWSFFLMQMRSLSPSDNFTIPFYFESITIPYHFSYHCLQSVWRQNQTQIILYGLQMEITSGWTINSFSPAIDCIGYFTIPILEAIFVTFILGLILTFGLCMILDIKTMDRFDDPKGKTITINAAE